MSTATVTPLTPTPKQPRQKWGRIVLDDKEQKKIADIIGDHGLHELDGMNVTQLKSYLAENASYIEATQDEMKADPDVQDHSEKLKLAKEPYRDALKALRAKRRYAVKLVSDRTGE